MAGNDPKWPGPVTFNDDDPKRGFCTVFLTIKDLKVSKSIFGKAVPKNATLNEDMFTAVEVLVKVIVTDSMGKAVYYEYNKPLPEGIDPALSTYKVKNNQVILSLCKAQSQSWAQHARYLIQRDTRD